jgi:thioester reductase-like protein
MGPALTRDEGGPMASILFTGFPGFLGSELLPRVLERHPDDEAVCLVQSKFMPLAQERAAALAVEHPAIAGRVRLRVGDIAQADLGLGDGYLTLAEQVVEIYHLAAIYDLSVARELAVRVNVDGTVHMLDFAAHCPQLRRFQYVSTCYVSGRYAGPFAETDLEKGQAFNNFYEETKYLAEVEVQKRMREGLPVTIYRPAVVVGDSRTGATQKYDGPYFVIQWLLRQPHLAIMPVVGDPTLTRFNVVPRDFVVEAIAHLSGLSRSEGKVYQLADPAPLTVEEILQAISHMTGQTLLRVHLPKELAKAAIDHVPGVYDWLRIPSCAIDYFVHPTHYLTTNAQADLEGSGITVPSFRDYAPTLVAFMRQHPEIGAKCMA